MERKKRSKGSVWEFCYAKTKFGKFEEEMRASGQKWVTFCGHTHTHSAKLVVRLKVRITYIKVPWTAIKLAKIHKFLLPVASLIR